MARNVVNAPILPLWYYGAGSAGGREVRAAGAGRAAAGGR
eukprot:COSAG01_NODE_41138_length_455_cov_1.081461_1_plen_39_part_10